MQFEKQISCYMAADFTAKKEICKPCLLVLYLCDECVDVCLHQTGSLKQNGNSVGEECVVQGREGKEGVSIQCQPEIGSN